MTACTRGDSLLFKNCKTYNYTTVYTHVSMTQINNIDLDETKNHI